MLNRFSRIFLAALLTWGLLPHRAVAQVVAEVRAAAGRPQVLIAPAGTFSSAGGPLVSPSPQFSPSPSLAAPAVIFTAPEPAAEPEAAPAIAEAAVAAKVAQAREILAASDQDAAAQAPSAWHRFWTLGRKSAARADGVAAEAPAFKPAALARPSASRKQPRAVAAFSGLTTAGMLPGGRLSGWISEMWLEFQPLLTAAGVLAATYAASRVVDWAIAAVGRKIKAGTDAVHMARFIGGLATWVAGASTGLHLAGTSGTLVAGTLGAGATLAVNETIGNFTQAILFMFYRPFSAGETIRIKDKLYYVEDDFTLETVKLRLIGTLTKEASPAAKAGCALVPYSQFDPSVNLEDPDTYKHAWLLETKAMPFYVKYSYLAKRSIGLFRPYIPAAQALHLSVPRLSLPSALKSGAGALKKSPWKALFTVALLALGPALGPLTSYLAWPWLTTIYPYLHAGILGLATYSTAGWAARLGGWLAERFGWPKRAAVVLGQGLVYLIGSTLTMRAIGMQWTDLLTGFVPVAGALIYALREVLGSLWQAVKFRFNRRVHTGNHIEFLDDEKGTLAEINKMYAILQTSAHSHVLVPYSVVEASPLGIPDGEEDLP